MNLEGKGLVMQLVQENVINTRWPAMAFNYFGTILSFLNKPYLVVVLYKMFCWIVLTNISITLEIFTLMLKISNIIYYLFPML